MTYNFSIKKAIVYKLLDESRAHTGEKTGKSLTGEYIAHFIDVIIENEHGMFYFIFEWVFVCLF